MGKVYERIDGRVREWMSGQRMFFVATAPRADSGSINLSPKGHDSLRVIDDRTLAFFDYGGSGIETVAHLRENGRIVLMMCAFDGPPRIFRFHGGGSVFAPCDAGFDELAAHFDADELGVRTIVRIDVERISDSCGFGVPLYDYQGQRRTSIDAAKRKTADEQRAYFRNNNAHSIDGLHGLEPEEANAFQPASAADREKPG